MAAGPLADSWAMASDRITSLDVARRAGVSQSAVSRVFTPGASFSRETARKVRQAARDLGYRPNELARSLITGRSRIIGLLVGHFENFFYPVAVEKAVRPVAGGRIPRAGVHGRARGRTMSRMSLESKSSTTRWMASSWRPFHSPRMSRCVARQPAFRSSCSTGIRRMRMSRP